MTCSPHATRPANALVTQPRDITLEFNLRVRFEASSFLFSVFYTYVAVTPGTRSVVCTISPHCEFLAPLSQDLRAASKLCPQMKPQRNPRPPPPNSILVAQRDRYTPWGMSKRCVPSNSHTRAFILIIVLQDIARLLHLAASSVSLLTLPQTDSETDNLPQGDERSEQFVLEVSEYFERLDVSLSPYFCLVSCTDLAIAVPHTRTSNLPFVLRLPTYDSHAYHPPLLMHHPKASDHELPELVSLR